MSEVEPCSECCCFRTCPWRTAKQIDKGAVPCKVCGCRWCGTQATRDQAYDQGIRDVIALLREEHAAGSFGSFDFIARTFTAHFFPEEGL